MTAITTKKFPVVTYLTVDVEAAAMIEDLLDEQNPQETQGRVVVGMMMITIAMITSPLVVVEVVVMIRDVRSLPYSQGVSADALKGRREYSSDESESPPRERRKSLGEQALAALGIGGAAGALAANGRSKSHGREGHGSRGGHRSRYDSSDDSRSRTRGSKKKDGGTQQEKIQQAVKAAVLAGATEAFRQRKEPGDWKGEKGKRVLTAAIGAGGINGLIDKDPNKGGTRHTIEAVIGGLAGNRLLNGSREEGAERERTRSQSRGRDGGGGGGGGGLAGLATGGMAAAAVKAFTDRAGGKSTDRARGRRYSDSDSEDSRDTGRRRRSKSVSDYARQGMAALGIGGDKNKRDDSRTRGAPRGGYDDYSPPRPRGGGGEGGDGIQDHRAQGSDSGSHSSNSSSEDDVSSSEEDRERKTLGRKQLITAGLASVATIHAAHSVYQSYEGRKKHQKEVRAGEMSPAEARKKKNRARLQEAASVGIAAIGIKGAYGEWKEMKEQRDEARELDKKREERHQRKLLKLEGHGSSHSPSYGSEPSIAHPDGFHDQYRASAPDLAPGYYPEPPGSQPGGFYGDTTHPGGPDIPHYSDGNPFHVGGVPPPPMGPEPQRY